MFCHSEARFSSWRSRDVTIKVDSVRGLVPVTIDKIIEILHGNVLFPGNQALPQLCVGQNISAQEVLTPYKTVRPKANNFCYAELAAAPIKGDLLLSIFCGIERPSKLSKVTVQR